MSTPTKKSKTFSVSEKIPLVKPRDHSEDTPASLDIIEDCVFYKTAEGLTRIELNKILFLEAASNYTNIYSFEEQMELTEMVNTSDEKNKPAPRKFKMETIKVVAQHHLRVTLLDVMKKLPEKNFIRVNRTYVINMDHVSQIGRNYILYKEDASVQYIPSKNHYEQLLARLTLLIPSK